MRARTRWIAGISAAAILLTTAVVASGYTGQVAATATVAVRGTVTCEEPFTLEATFLDAAGAPVPDLSVDWSFVTSPSSEDSINETPTITNADGVATTTVSLAAVNGERRIRATAGDVSASVVVTQACGGLPRTDTLPADTGLGLPLLALVIVGLAVAGGGAFAYRRRA